MQTSRFLIIVFQGPYDVVLLPGGMPGAQNLAEVRNGQINDCKHVGVLYERSP